MDEKTIIMNTIFYVCGFNVVLVISGILAGSSEDEGFWVAICFDVFAVISLLIYWLLKAF